MAEPEFNSGEQEKSGDPDAAEPSWGKARGRQAEDALEMKKLYRQTLENP